MEFKYYRYTQNDSEKGGFEKTSDIISEVSEQTMFFEKGEEKIFLRY